MKDEIVLPERASLLFEVSWEVANKVGGIHTVIVGKAPLLYQQREGAYWLIGPYLTTPIPAWQEVHSLYADWRDYFLREKGIPVHAGYWTIQGFRIPTILIDFYPALAHRNEIFARWWERYGVDSLWGDWDYIEPAIFGYVAGMVIESFRSFYYGNVDTIAHFHEWLTGGGVLYLEEHIPAVATVFTTHATVAGRAAEGRLIPLSELEGWLRERRLISKHTLERAAWHQADTTTTVSEIISREAAYYLGRAADFITPNGWQAPSDLPIREARQWLRRLAEQWGWAECPTWILHSGRPELENKGTLALIEAIARYREAPLRDEPVSFIFAVPGDAGAPREAPVQPFWVSHALRHPERDELFQRLRALQLREEEPIRIAYLPVYLEGNDGVLNLPYYALLAAVDATAFPSKYEPWGYTPQESLGVGVPTLASYQGGFGRWMLEHVRSLPEALSLMDYERPDPPDQILRWLKQRLQASKADRDRLRQEALKLAERTTWTQFLPFYLQAYQVALTKAQTRLWHKLTPPPSVSEKRVFTWHRAFFLPNLPDNLRPLSHLAYNLWWSWNPDAQQLFRYINPDAWERHENPVWLLNHTSSQRWEALSQDEEFLRMLRQILQRFQSYMAQPPRSEKPTVAYLCMEYGIAKCLPFYSGGLGVLAGDYLKEASDQRYPMIGIGLLYRRGYFQQRISPEGEQVAENPALRFTDLPIEPVREADGRWLHVRLTLGELPILLKVWRVHVGRVPLYLLDADLAENPPEVQEITARLYEGDAERRLQQELVLGLGAQKLVEALKLQVELFHYNEGHPAFHLLALWMHLKEAGYDLRAAQEEARLRVLFTTHTPVPAGHDAFPSDLLQKYLYDVVRRLGVPWERFMKWGEMPEEKGKFSLTAFCLRFAGQTNAVSQLHARVSQRMFAGLYEGYLPQEIPIRGITNGVHVTTWQAPEWTRSRRTWETHQMLRSALLSYLRRRLLSEPGPVAYLEAIRAFFAQMEEGALLMGFARRFATYKRHGMLFEHESLRRLFAEEPVRLIIAGKAHPRDEAGKKMLRTVWQRSLEPPFVGKVLFVPDYDMQLARYLIQGVDVWLNLPIFGNEASGTSGMKAALNGVLHLSIPDGWWAEVDPTEAGGWSIPVCQSEAPEIRDAWEATQLAYLLREEVLPVYRARDARGIPMEWIARMERAQAYAIAHFSTGRMLEEYDEKMYRAAHQKLAKLSRQTFERRLALLKRIEAYWDKIRLRSVALPPFSERAHPTRAPFRVEIEVEAGGLPAEALQAEIVFESADGQVQAFHLEPVGEGRFRGEVQIADAGVYHYAVRVYAWDTFLQERLWDWVHMV